MSASPCQFHLLNGGFAARTGLLALSIDLEFILELPSLMVGGKRFDRGSLALDGLVEDTFGKQANLLQFLCTQCFAVSGGMDMSFKQNFICIDVPNSTDNFLIEEHFFDCFLSADAGQMKVFRVEGDFVVGLGSQFGDRGMVHLLSLLDQVHRAELTHIVVDETGPVSEEELDMIVLLGFEVLLFEEVFALHPQMRNDAVVLQVQNQMFAVSVDAGEPLSQQFADKLSRIGLFDDPWVEGLDCFDGLGLGTQQHFFQESPNDLYLRQLRHQIQQTRQHGKKIVVV